MLDEQLEINIPRDRAVKLKTKSGLEPKISEGVPYRIKDIFKIRQGDEQLSWYDASKGIWLMSDPGGKDAARRVPARQHDAAQGAS